jgi:hypothetical protein
MSLLRFLNRNVSQYSVDMADRLSDRPEPTFWSKWFGGLIIPGLLAAYGAHCCWVQQATFHGRGGSALELHGSAAVAYGVAWISAGLFAHFHYFWSSLERLHVFMDLGKLVALVALLGAIGAVAWLVMAQ